MTPEPDVELLRLLSEVGMRAGERSEDALTPLFMRLRQHPLARLRGGSVTQGVVLSDHGAARHGVQILMHGVYITEGRTAIDDTVPGGQGTGLGGSSSSVRFATTQGE